MKSCGRVAPDGLLSGLETENLLLMRDFCYRFCVHDRAKNQKPEGLKYEVHQLTEIQKGNRVCHDN